MSLLRRISNLSRLFPSVKLSSSLLPSLSFPLRVFSDTSLPLSSLTALSPLDGRYASSTAFLRPHFSEFGLIRNRVKVEIAWLLVLVREDMGIVKGISEEAKRFLHDLVENFSLQDAQEVKKIEKKTNHDVKAVEYFIKGKFAESKLKELHQLSEWVHFGATSEDINNLAYALAWQDVKKLTVEKLVEIEQVLKTNARNYSGVALLARTHGQTASPTTVGKEFAVFAHRLESAVGNYNALCVAYPLLKWDNISKKFIEDFGLKQNEYTTQIEPHDFAASFSLQLSQYNNVLIGLTRDLWGYISLGYFKLKVISGEIGSSTMPHKVNPIDFENCEGNLGLSNAVFSHLASKLTISRFQRDLSDSTVQRSIGTAFGYSFIAYASLLKGLSKITINEDRLDGDLNRAWEVLAEPIQTVMRACGIESPYELLKQHTRGKEMTEKSMRDFIRGLNIPDKEKTRLLELTPQNYVGLAQALAKKV